MKEPNPEVVKTMIALREKGYRILIYSTRGNEFLEKYCEQFSIPYDFINHNPEMQGENPGKPVAYAYVDDTAICYKGQSSDELLREVEDFRAYWKPDKQKQVDG